MMPGTFGVTLKRKRELTRMVFGISMRNTGTIGPTTCWLL